VAERASHAWQAALAVLTLLPLGCAQPPPGEGTRREASVPAVPALVRHTPPPPIRTAWTFQASDTACVAVAAAAGTSLLVSIRRDAPIRAVVALETPAAHGPASVPLRFTGPAGAWQVAAHRSAARRFTVTLGADDTALSRVLILLSGGTLELGEPAQPIVALSIGASDTQGQAWFDCARGKLL
jgi:hypothetical protein